VKEEVYRVARRVGLDVHVVANSFIRTPMERGVKFVADFAIILCMKNSMMRSIT
jgi:uncharacterized protein YaiI (UPF0178 family)